MPRVLITNALAQALEAAQHGAAEWDSIVERTIAHFEQKGVDLHAEAANFAEGLTAALTPLLERNPEITPLLIDFLSVQIFQLLEKSLAQHFTDVNALDERIARYGSSAYASAFLGFFTKRLDARADAIAAEQDNEPPAPTHPGTDKLQ